MDGVKCSRQNNCPYFESISSYEYGAEIIKCGNTDCSLYSVEKEREEEE